MGSRHRARTVRQRYQSGTPWEPIVGYSRAVRVGQHVYVTGTTATDNEGHIVGIGDPYAQTIQIFRNIERALEAVGARVGDIVRTRIYVTDISQWEAVGRAHRQAVGHVMPATSMLEVSRLIDPNMLVEIEVDAIIADPIEDR